MNSENQRTELKPFTVKLGTEEKMMLEEISKIYNRSMSAVIRSLIRNNYRKAIQKRQAVEA